HHTGRRCGCASARPGAGLPREKSALMRTISGCMKIVRIHNYYQQAGGEDSVLASEIKLLESRGHAVSTFFIHNDAIEGMGRLALLGKTLWNAGIYGKLRAFFREQQADVAHFDNTFPLISPAAYYAARAEGVGVVQ